MSGRHLDSCVARRVTAFAAAISVLLAAALPIGHFSIAREREMAGAQAEARILAAGVSSIVARNPDHWRSGPTRLVALMAREADAEVLAIRRVRDVLGATVAELSAAVPHPRMTVRAPVLDAGRIVGEVQIIRSLRGILVEATWVALVAAALGLAAFAALRAVPLRLLDRALERAAHLAAHDALTGLPNRVLLRERMVRMLAEARRDGGGAALLMLDLDRFKPVNDLHGHVAGDRLLQLVAERLRATVRETDTVARLGGDEFAIAARVDAEGAERLARRVVAALEEPFELGTATARIGCSVGIALGTGDGADGDILARQADAALYRSKAEGRGCFRFFESGMDARIRERAALEAELRLAIAQNALVPHFQPLVELGSGRLVAFEMLARWPHPTRGQIAAAEFIPIAEDTGLIVPMTERLLRQGCRAAAAWPEQIALAANLSPLQLRDRALPELVRAVLEEAGLPPHRLELELTESALVADFALAQTVLAELKAVGVRLALDDFGTGYSSLAHLQLLPFDKIKIDGGFVRAMAGDPGAHKIVSAVVGLGHSLGLPTVAEGVEEPAQAEVLCRLGCDIGQGWLFGTALPEAEAAALAAAGALAAPGRVPAFLPRGRVADLQPQRAT